MDNLLDVWAALNWSLIIQSNKVCFTTSIDHVAILWDFTFLRSGRILSCLHLNHVFSLFILWSVCCTCCQASKKEFPSDVPVFVKCNFVPTNVIYLIFQLLNHGTIQFLFSFCKIPLYFCFWCCFVNHVITGVFFLLNRAATIWFSCSSTIDFLSLDKYFFSKNWEQPFTLKKLNVCCLMQMLLLIASFIK